MRDLIVKSGKNATNLVFGIYLDADATSLYLTTVSIHTLQFNGYF